ncbi:SbcC/MukB-like Walker B domain-containing protein [Puerhibacterium sp. TATVAM-FAB25]|uniref:SbcC/MukB-like Walker B domain-containing protein n=1 Tax=Puerhibacterium sp. TATVAM-FAB25 TaxID=3093699 RepID=UPI0039792828
MTDTYAEQTAFDPEELKAPATWDLSRFACRWRLVGFGVVNVWRYAQLELPAPSGRLLLRGSNGTGKTTALELLWPYLLDLEGAKHKLAAGKNRATTLKDLLRENRGGDKRIGYAWMTVAGPGDAGELSYGVRLTLAGDTVKINPFRIPGRPLHDLALTGPDGRSSISSLEAFTEAVEAAGGRVFEDAEAYQSDLAAHVFGARREMVVAIADRVRRVRRPDLMEATTPNAAAQVLREALPGVDVQEIEAVAKALAETETTREAFERDLAAADRLAEFDTAYQAYTVAQVRTATDAAAAAHTRLDKARKSAQSAATAAQKLDEEAEAAEQRVTALEADEDATDAEITAIEKLPAFSEIANLQLLQQAARSARASADAHLSALTGRVERLSDDAATVHTDAQRLAGQVRTAGQEATTADPQAGTAAVALTVSTRPHALLQVGDVALDPGVAVEIADPAEQLAAAREHWSALGRAHRETAAGAQTLRRRYEREVLGAQREAKTATKTADREAEAANAAAAQMTARHAALREAITATVTKICEWIEANPDLAQDADGPGQELDLETVREHGDDPEALVAAADDWAQHVTVGAANEAGRLHHEALGLLTQAEQLRTQAKDLREEARQLRAGKLLAPPRPAWAAPAGHVLTDALTWPEHTDAGTQALVEAALSAAGLLGAELTPAGVRAAAWTVTTAGPTLEHALSAVVTVDPDHELAGAATAVLDRIAYAPSAAQSPAASVIGADGTFRLGVLAGRAPGTEQPHTLPASRFVGAAQRLAAARARAEQLDADAVELDTQASALTAQAAELDTRGTAVKRRAAQFPARRDLRDTSREHAAAVRDAGHARDRAEQARKDATELTRAATTAERTWKEQALAMGLPTDPDAMEPTAQRENDAGAQLEQAASTLVRLEEQIGRLLARAARVSTDRERLAPVHALACETHAQAAKAEATFEQVNAKHGQEVAALNAQHDAAKRKLEKVRGDLRDARGKQTTAVSKAASQREIAVQAKRTVLEQEEPAAAQALGVLVALCQVADVRDVLQLEVAPDAGPDLIEQVRALIAGRATRERKSTEETFEKVRAALAPHWAVDRDRPFQDGKVALETYRCTHDGQTLTVPAAARYAAELRDRAADQLSEAEQNALQDFIVRRMPAAISTAWHEMNDWIDAVNKKMSSTAASSGVRVRVRLLTRDDLSPAQRTVHALACKKSAATRTQDESDRLADALKALLSGSVADTMQGRVAEAMDVADWIRLEYRIHRPGKDTDQPWTTRTGLSTGESRLVTLAPMLASVAALYDSLPDTALRLAALDEIPATVDGHGLDGLARYIGTLDLDLVCTSHGWDGAPGAWDAVDLHDLEAWTSGWVLGFHTPVRAHGVRCPEDPEFIQ